MKISILLTLAFLLTAHVPPNPSSADMTPAELGFGGTGGTRPGKDIALFFAVETYAKYGHGLRDLQNPIDNAEAIAKVLKDQYGFETEVVPNPTLDVIEHKLGEYKNKFSQGRYPYDGQLFIFFSGHGQRELKNG